MDSLGLDVEETARAKKMRGKGVVGGNANFIQKNINACTNNSQKGKKKPPPPPNQEKQKQTTTLKKKKGNCYVCGSPDHFAGKCLNHKGAKSANMVVSETGGISGNGNYLPTILLVLCPP